MKKIIGVTFLFVSPFVAFFATAQTIPLKQKIEKYTAGKSATIGVAVAGIEDRDTVIVNGAGHYPMQSIYKFHLAVAVLDQVDKGKFTYDQKITVKKEEVLPDTHSPLRDAFPEGALITLKELLTYAVSESDNNACDILFRLLGGPKEVNKYIHALGVRDVLISTTEEDANKKWETQYTNWTTPYAAVQLLKKYNEKGILSPKSHDLLWSMMVSSVKNDRIKGRLPEGTVVAHKTGTSGTNAAHLTAATNDIGIVELPGGKHFSIAVLVSDSKEADTTNANIIADITKIVWDHYAEKALALQRQKYDYMAALDSLVNVAAKAKKPFNGTVLISQNGRKLYYKVFGFSDMERKSSIVPNDQYVIGSISKQITAVLVLQEVEKGHILLSMPIREYLPDLPQPWADSVTVHQLLTHTHGIVAIDKPLISRPGKIFTYSELGFDLLAQILEKTTKKTFMMLTNELFEKCNMRNTFHPGLGRHKNLVKGYIEQPDGKLALASKMPEQSVAALGFVSTASDLLAWNTLLHSGKLFADSNLYAKMISGYAVRDHPVFGPLDYGYGITTTHKENIYQLGQTGNVPGYLTLDFYYPDSKTNIIILSNIARNADDPKTAFWFHLQALEVMKQSSLIVRD